MRRLLLLGQIGGQRSVPIVIVWLLSLSVALHGQDGKAHPRSAPAPSSEITTGTVVVQKAPDLPLRGDADDHRVTPPQGDRGEAVADDAEAIKRSPQDAPTYATLGDHHAESGALDKAIADYTEAIKLDARYAYAYARRASAWMKKHERQKAIADYSAAIALEPRNPFHFLSRGAVWSRQGDHAPAIADFDEAIRLDPSHAGAFISRALEWELDYQLEKAILDFERAITLDPRAIPAYEGCGRVWAKRGEYAKIVANFAELARKVPDDPVGHRELAWLLATCEHEGIRDGRRAVGEATTACALTKWADARCLETLAAACAAVGDFDAAVKWQTRALEIFAANKDKYDLRIKKRQDADMNLRLYRYKRRMPHTESPERVVR
jgi:Tfp pilus assembly protein PilF